MGQKISIIVPVYNKEKYVARAIESILVQTHKNLDIILINDGSTDESEAICKQKAAKDDRIRCLSQPNAGPSAARNKGIELATGDYLAFLDADDAMMPHAIESMLACMQEYEAQLVVSRQKINSGRHVQITGNVDGPTGLLTKDQFFKSLAGDTIGVFWGSQGNKLYSKNIILENHLRFEVGRDHAEDFLFNLEYYKLLSKIAFLDEITYEIYDIPASLSKQSGEAQLALWGEDVWRALTLFYRENHQERYLPWVNAIFCKIVRGAMMEHRRNGSLSFQSAYKTIVAFARMPWVAQCIQNSRSDSAKQQVAVQCFQAKAYWCLAALYCITER